MRLVFGTFMTLLFVMFMMKKSVRPFEDCDGKATIVIFFLQTVRLLSKDKGGEFLGTLSNAADFSFYRHTPSSCTVPLNYYQQFFVDLFISPVSMIAVYLVVMAITYATSHKVELSSYATQTVGSAARSTLIVKALGRMDTFKMLSTEDRHVLARLLSLRYFKAGEDILVEGNVPEQQYANGETPDQGEFYIICKGEVAIKIKDFGVADGQSHLVRTLQAGSFFGDIALLANGPRTATVTALDDVQCASMTRRGFAELLSTFKHNDEFVRTFNVGIRRIRDTVDDPSEAGDELILGPHAGTQRDTAKADTRVIDEAQRRAVLLYRKKTKERARQRVHEFELRIKSKHAGCFAKIPLRLHDELMLIYHACINPTARRAAALEISISLYGPLTLQAMQVLFCKNVNEMSYPVTDPAIDCTSPTHKSVQVFAGCCLFTVIVGVIAAMYFAAANFYDALEADPYKDGLTLAKELCGDRWEHMSIQEQKREVERCGHRLRVQILGQECFMLSSLQMSVSRECAQWYPQWHLFRRTLLNFAYMGGLARGGKMSPLFWDIDWRVFVMVVLTISSTLQYHYRPFRDDQDDRLEMWGLQFIMVMVVVDFGHDNSSANGASSLFVTVVLTVVFLMIAVNAVSTDFRRTKKSKGEWVQLRAWYHHDELNETVYRQKLAATEDALQAKQKAAHEDVRFAGVESALSTWDPNYKKKKKQADEEEYRKYRNPMLRAEGGGDDG